MGVMVSLQLRQRFRDKSCKKKQTHVKNDYLMRTKEAPATNQVFEKPHAALDALDGCENRFQHG
jgi:hypothetical protein